MRRHNTGVEVDGPTITGRRFPKTLKVGQHIAEVGMPRRAVGIEQHRSAECRRGLFEPAKPTQGVAEMVLRLGELWSSLHSSPTVRQRSDEIPLFAKELTKVAVGRSEIRPQCDGAAVVGRSYGNTSYQAVGVAKVGVGFGKLRQYRHSLADQLYRPVATTLAKCEDSKQVKGVGVVRYFMKDLAVKRGGPLEAAGLMVLEAAASWPATFASRWARLATVAMFRRSYPRA